MKHSTGKVGLLSLMPAMAMAALFTACGDEVTEVTQVSEITGLEVLASGEKLGDCTKDNVGEMLFVTDSSAVFYCADGKWQTLNGKDGSKGSDGENGKDGKPGENGKNGDDGSSCTAKTVEEGIEVSCGGKVVGTSRMAIRAMMACPALQPRMQKRLKPPSPAKPPTASLSAML